jgi:hypothetical protein
VAVAVVGLSAKAGAIVAAGVPVFGGSGIKLEPAIVVVGRVPVPPPIAVFECRVLPVDARVKAGYNRAVPVDVELCPDAFGVY